MAAELQTPAPRLRRRNHGKGHSYRIDGEKVIGVTTALNAKAKPALIDWASRVTAEYAVNRWDELAELPVAERLSRIGRARWETTNEAAVRGTRIHALADQLAHGVAVEVPDELRGPVEAYARFLDDWQIETWATETPCANVTHRYAGTADAWGRIGRLGESALLDVKTGRGVYNETALQLAAYRYTELWQPNGEGSEASPPAVDAVYVAHVLPDSVRLLPVVAGEQEFREFLYVLQSARWDTAVKDDPLIGDAIYTEGFHG